MQLLTYHSLQYRNYSALLCDEVFVVYEQIFIIIGYCPAVNLIYKPIKS